MKMSELAIQNDNGCFMLAGSGMHSYCSMVPNNENEQIALFNAINSPQKKLSSMINLEVAVKDVFAEECTYIDKETGEPLPGVRIVLIDEKGESYSTSSRGIFNGLSKLFALFGTPDHWKKPIKIKVRQVSVAVDKNVLVFDIVK